MIKNKKGKEDNNFEKIIEKINKRFIEIIESDNPEEKLRLEFFREKYTHFMLYSELKKNEWNVIWEKETELKFKVTGNKDKSGNHDLVVVGGDNKPVAGFEIFLGYDVGEKSFTSTQFKEHLLKDYKKLINSSMDKVYIINYFYKGESKRSTKDRTDKKKKKYLEHFSSCVSACNKIAKKHKDSNLPIELGLWMIEARDDGIDGIGAIRII